jgi:hypothetical protein
MPLSEDEQRILRQIEEQLQRDPNFGRDIKPRHVGSRQTVILSSIATLLCLVFTVVLLAVSPLLSFAAFVGALGEAGLTHLGESVRSRLGGSAGGRSD